MNIDLIIAIAIAISIIGTIAFAVGIVVALGMLARHPRRPDPIENFEGEWK